MWWWRTAWLAVLAACMSAQGVVGDFMSVQVTPATQCGRSVVTWSGDAGPWHLLLTPTDFVQHGYNLWVPEIPSNHTNWTIPIRQPAGMNFMVTMWGASGIRYAGTTDILTVQPPLNTTNATCYLNDTEILNLYTFSFNISDVSSGYPPQCSNLSMSWPTSLESPVTPPVEPSRNTSRGSNVNDIIVSASRLSNAPIEVAPLVGSGSSSSSILARARRQVVNDNPSSSDRTNGNTTKPPTMFGVIPMGNSFEIPITFSRQAAFSYKLPDDVISDDPTTWTRQGVTYLNWTVPLAKGTRFLLVAGIGDDQQWASGGSSRMMTVGQGTEACLWPDDHGGGSVTTDVPSVTGSSTATPSIRFPDESTRGSSERGGMTVGTIIACALSIAATLLIVGLCFCCCRIRRRRKAAAALTAYRDPNPKRGLPPSESELPLDLISSRTASDQHYTPHQLAPLDTSPTALSQSRVNASPTASDPFRDTPLDRYRGLPRVDALRGEPMTPISPQGGAGTGPASPGGWGRQSSQEALLHSSLTSPIAASATHVGFGPGTGTGTYPSYPSLSSRSTGLRMDAEGTARRERERDMPDLKRDVIAFLGDGPGSATGSGSGHGHGYGYGSGSGSGSGFGYGGASASARGRSRAGRRPDEEEDGADDGEMQYVVHRDAGRPRVMELPPRYEELTWEREGEREGPAGGGGGGGGGGADTGTGTGTGGLSVDMPARAISPISPVSPVLRSADAAVDSRGDTAAALSPEGLVETVRDGDVDGVGGAIPPSPVVPQAHEQGTRSEKG